MLTKQMWLVAHLSDTKEVERVEAVVGSNDLMYIADHPRRCLTLGVDLHETFNAARSSSVLYLDNKLQNMTVLRDAIRSQTNPYIALTA